MTSSQIAYQRKASKLSMDHLARFLGVSEKEIRLWENGVLAPNQAIEARMVYLFHNIKLTRRALTKRKRQASKLLRPTPAPPNQGTSSY